jgi:hypothetical protein
MATTYDKASLVMIPSGYKDDKLYSIKPTDGSGDFTFSRDGAGASPATRVNASGYIEKGRENLTTFSNDPDNWIKSSASVTSGQSGYDGTSDAWLLNATAVGGHTRRDVNWSGVSTFSIYAKAGTADGMRIRLDAATDRNLYINLSTGSIITDQTEIGYKIESVGSGWYRISSTNNIVTGINYRIYPSDAAGASVVGSIYIQDAQLEQGLVATDYIETTTAPVSDGLLGDMPRLDYSGGATCPSLLLEPSRVNIIESSEYLGHSSWVFTRITQSANEAVSPEGVQNATLIANTTDTGAHSAENPLGSYTNASLAVSFYAKKKDNDYLQFGIYNSSTKWAAQKINLATGAILGSGNTGFHDAPSGVNVTPVGNDWYKVEALFTTSLTSASETLYLAPTPTDANPTGNFGLYGGWTGSTSENAYIYGVQVEASASYPTSYIPTYGSASTRGRDVADITSASAMIGSEGVVFIEVQGITDEGPSRRVSLSDGTNDNRAMIEIDETNNQIKGFVSQSGTTIGVTGSPYPHTDNNKIALKYTATSIDLFINGVNAASDTLSGSPIGMDEVHLYQASSSARWMEGKVKQFLVFDSALTDAECINLTTL